MLFYRFSDTQTAVAGVWSVKLSKGLPLKYIDIQSPGLTFQPQMIAQVLIRSASTDTTYNATLTDFEGHVIRTWTLATEVVNDLTPTPVMGDVTLAVNTSSADEAFKILVILNDQRTR